MHFLRTLSLLAIAAMPTAFCHADNFSFTGNFVNDNDVQAFVFNVGATSTVTLQTFSYAGGTNAAGHTIARGGFDPILALFSGTGSSAVFINQNDDGVAGQVPADPLTGQYFDTYLQSPLAPGTYTVSIMEYNNFANGPTFGSGFRHDGDPNFLNGRCTQNHFCDVSGVTPYNNRDTHWAFDIDGVNSAVVINPNPIPEPSTITLLGTGLIGAAGMLRRRFAR